MKIENGNLTPAEEINPPTATKPSLEAVQKAVVTNQLLWTAGAALNSTGFLVFFCKELGAAGLAITILLAIPETMGLIGNLSRTATRFLGSRKTVWLLFSLLAGIMAAFIPLLAWREFRELFPQPIFVLIIALLLASACQAIAYSALISWLSELVQREKYGALFSKKEISKVLILVFVPLGAALFRESFRTSTSPLHDDWQFTAYGLIFSAGIILQLIALIPILWLPAIPITAAGNTTSQRSPSQPSNKQPSNWRIIISTWKNRSLRTLILGHWWLAAFQGLTQALFIFYLFGNLKVGLHSYYALMGMMFLLQIPFSGFAGWWSDKYGDKKMLVASLFLTACAMPFWFLAEYANPYWIVGAYLFWGCFAMTNIAGRNLLLRLSPKSDNQIPLWLFRQGSGVLAGIMGIVGYLCFHFLQKHQIESILFGYTLKPYHILFLISAIGRLIAPMILMFVEEPKLSQSNSEKTPLTESELSLKNNI